MPTTPVRGTTTACLLPISAGAPRHARRIVGRIDELAPYPDLRFAAQLLAGELVSNAVRHTGLPTGESISLLVHCDEDIVHVEVRDGGPGFDGLGLLRGHRRRGDWSHGLFLVNALADRWGYRRETACAWFEIDLVPGRRPWRGRERIPEPNMHPREIEPPTR